MDSSAKKERHRPRRWIKRVLIALTTLVLVAVAFTAVALIAVETDQGRQWLTGQASKQLGRQVTLSDIDIDYGSVTGIRFTALSIDNPDWAARPKLLQLDSLLLRIRLLPLLRGQLVFERISADNPEVHLQRRADGSSSWQFNDGSARPANDKSKPLSLPRIEKLHLNGGSINYSDTPFETELALKFGSDGSSASGGNINQQAEPLNGPDTLTANGEIILSGRRLNIDIQAGSPTQALNSVQPETTYPAKFHISGDSLDLRLSGEVDALLQPQKAKLEFSFQGTDLNRWNEIALLRSETPLLPAIDQYSATATLRAEYGMWHADYLQLEADGNRLQGELHADSTVQPLSVTAKLQASSINVSQIQSWLPESGPSQPLDVKLAGQLQQLAELPLQVDVQLNAADINIEPRRIDSVQVNASLKKGRLTVQQLALEAEGSSVTAEAFIDSRSKPVNGSIKLKFEGLRPHRIAEETDVINALPEPLAGRLRGEIEAKFSARRVTTQAAATNIEKADASVRPADSGDVTHQTTLQLKSLSVPLSTLRFRDQDYDSDVTLALKMATLDDRRNTPTEARLDANGRWRGEPLETRVTLSELPSLQSLLAILDASTAIPPPTSIAVNAQLGRSTATVNGQLNTTWPPLPKTLTLTLESPSPAEVAAAFSVDLPFTEPLSMRAEVNQTQDKQWLLQLTNTTLGDSDLTGKVRLGVREDAGLNLEAQFNSQRFEITSLQVQRSDSGPTTKANSESLEDESSRSEATTANGFIAPVWLQNMDGRLQININELGLPKSQFVELESVVLFERGTIRLQPLKFPLGGGSINATGRVDVTVVGLTGELNTDINAVDVGEVMQQFSEPLDDEAGLALGELDGRIQLRLAEAANRQQQALTLDGISDRLQIKEAGLQYDDPNLGASTDLIVRAANLNSGLTVSGTVNYRDRPSQITLKTGSLRQAIENPMSFPIDASLVNRKTTIKLDGNVGTLLPIEQLQAKVGLQGPGTADLGEWLDIPLPDFPPYDLTANVKRSQTADGRDRVSLNGMRGKVGDSDLNGDLAITLGGAKPDIKGALQSDLLDFDDLAGLIGAAPDPSETASAEQEQEAEIKASSPKLLPNKPLDFSALQKVNANVEYRAKSVLAPSLPLDDFSLDMNLHNGQLKIPRLNFGLADGTVALELEVNANEAPASSKLTGNFDGVRLNDLLKNVENINDAVGTIGGSITLWMKGTSLAEWLGSADGGSYLTMTGGQIDALLIELAGLDIGESLALFFGNETEVTIDCAYVDLQARQGIVTLDPMLLDTADTHFIGDGSIDLTQEAMDITIKPYPKDFTLLSARGPLKIGGTLKNPAFGVRPSIPLPELGLSEGSARCDGLVTELRNARKENAVD